jgi:hypothetical protein
MVRVRGHAIPFEHDDDVGVRELLVHRSLELGGRQRAQPPVRVVEQLDLINLELGGGACQLARSNDGEVRAVAEGLASPLVKHNTRTPTPVLVRRSNTPPRPKLSSSG